MLAMMAINTGLGCDRVCCTARDDVVNQAPRPVASTRMARSKAVVMGLTGGPTNPQHGHLTVASRRATLFLSSCYPGTPSSTEPDERRIRIQSPTRTMRAGTWAIGTQAGSVAASRASHENDRQELGQHGNKILRTDSTPIGHRS